MDFSVVFLIVANKLNIFQLYLHLDTYISKVRNYFYSVLVRFIFPASY